MRNVSFLRTFSVLPLAAISLLGFSITGCGIAGSGAGAKSPLTDATGGFSLRGTVYGGQQPVSGASIKMYAAGTTGYGSASVSILNAGVTVTSSTDGSGSFTLTGKYTCTPEQRVYLTATGGDAGAGANSALAMMAALGRCGDLTSSTFISLNEVTTVGSVWALAPFMSGIASIGAPASNTVGINNAFADVNALASIARGAAGGDRLPAGATIPVAAVNTIADILASCINSNGGRSSTCSTLFGATTTGGNVPTDTVAAALSMALHPAVGVATLYPLSSSTAPFQPTLVDQPSDFTLAETFAGANLSTPQSVAMDASGNAWIVDSTTNKLSTVAHDGTSLFTVSGLSAPSSVAVDQSGNGWIANSGNATLTKVNAGGGAMASYTGGGLNIPKSVAIDGQGNLWIANSGNNRVSEFNSSGVALSSTGYATTGATPIGVALTPQ